jgi:hypothetical protein
MTQFAKFISFLFHPVFMPLVGLIIIFNSGVYFMDVPVEYKRFVYLVVILCHILLPLSILPVLIYLKHLRNYSLDIRRERLIPLFFTTICFYIGYYFVSKLAPVRLINLFLFSSTVVIFILLFVSLFWKISIHMTGIGGLTGMILVLSFTYGIDSTIVLSFSIFVAGLIATSRLALQSHSILQLTAGYLTGLLSVFVLMMQIIL